MSCNTHVFVVSCEVCGLYGSEHRLGATHATCPHCGNTFKLPTDTNLRGYEKDSDE